MPVRRSRLLVWKRPRNELWNNTCVCVLHKLGQCCVQVWISTCERRWTSSSQPTPMEVDAVMSTCARCGKAGHEKARCRFRNFKCSTCGKTGHLRAMCRQREKSAGKSSPLEQQLQEFWQRRHEPWKHRQVLLLWTGRSSDDLIALAKKPSRTLRHVVKKKSTT